jgi:hypothetical protein
VTINALVWLGAVLWFLATFFVADYGSLWFVLVALASLSILAGFVIFRHSARSPRGGSRHQ